MGSLTTRLAPENQARTQDIRAFGLQHQIGILELLAQPMYTLIPTKMDPGIVQMKKLERPQASGMATMQEVLGIDTKG